MDLLALLVATSPFQAMGTQARTARGPLAAAAAVEAPAPRRQVAVAVAQEEDPSSCSATRHSRWAPAHTYSPTVLEVEGEPETTAEAPQGTMAAEERVAPSFWKQKTLPSMHSIPP